MKLYKTDSLALAPYLQMNQLEYIGAELTYDNKRGLFVFSDDDNAGDALALEFLRSEHKKYHGLWGFFRNQLAQLLKKHV